MSNKDRRGPGATRVAFDGLVEVGGSVGPSFEALALNVSQDGMQLRTTYLPELGQQVTCRFEATPGKSVIASGDVVWSQAAERGGEFGIRFTDMDQESVDLLKRMCFRGERQPMGHPGSKVRLYIEGLASPMRAKVRDADAAAVTVGSDLGFLQVGKDLELEDAQNGNKRPASIDGVHVTVDPSSHIPQLVVTLRYTDMPAHDAANEPDARGASEASLPYGTAGRDSSDADPLAGWDDPTFLMKGTLARTAARIGAAIPRLVRRTRTTIALLAKRLRSDEGGAPRRTTALPPGGGLHSSGRRVVRGEGADGLPSTKPSTAKRKVATVMAATAAAIALTAFVKKSHDLSQAPSSAAATTPTDTASALSASGPGAAKTQGSSESVATPARGGETVGVSASREAAGSEQPAASHQAPSTEEGAEASAAPSHPRRHVAPFGNGPVHHGNILRLKMDGPIESIEGVQQPTGFIVKLPGRRSLEAAAPLAARDARLAAIKVSNGTTGAELNVAFKDGVPNYQVSARGDVLVIALAPAGPLEPLPAPTVAKREERSATHGTRGSRDTRDRLPER